MGKKKIILILIILWFIFSGGILYYLLSNDYLSAEVGNTYLVLPHGGRYNAPTGYLEYYLSQEGGGLNKYAAGNMNSFPTGIDTGNNN